MRTDLQGLIKTLDLQISALTKAKSALEAAQDVLAGKPHAGPAVVTPGPGSSIRAHIMAALERQPKMTGRELHDAIVARGWKTTSTSTLNLVGVTVRHLVKTGELRRTNRTKPHRFAVGTIIERPEKKQPWQKKLETAQALVASRKTA